MLFDRVIASIPCSECQKWVYDMETGERETYPVGDGKTVLPYARDGAPPPCQQGFQCPKESPEKEHLHVLNGRNVRLFRTYLRERACPSHEPREQIVRDAFAIVDGLYEEWNSRRLARDVLSMLPAAMA